MNTHEKVSIAIRLATIACIIAVDNLLSAAGHQQRPDRIKPAGQSRHR
jgi:hypothetical protein